MQTDQAKISLPTDEVTRSIIGCAFTVSNVLKVGFLEKVYENALAIELKMAGHDVEQQWPIQVGYRGQVVGDYFADLLVDRQVIVELKTVKSLDSIHLAQCMNYLHATQLDVALLINFGRPKIEYKRILRPAHPFVSDQSE